MVGSVKSKASAAYPMALAKDYATLAVCHFMNVGKFEYLKVKHASAEEKLRKIRKVAEAKGIPLDDRVKVKGIKRSYEDTELDFDHSSVHDWRGGDGPNESLRSSKAKVAEPRHTVYVGGMRHPARVVRSMATAQSLGIRIGAAWDYFMRKFPQIEELAENYGSSTSSLPKNLVIEWREVLKRLVGAEEASGVRLSGKYEYVSTVDAELVEGWIRKVGDPDVAIPTWIRQGVPLGIHCPIQCCGIFPPSGETEAELAMEDASSFLSKARSPTTHPWNKTRRWPKRRSIAMHPRALCRRSQSEKWKTCFSRRQYLV